MAIKTISQFDAATPASNDKILFEQNGEGKNCSIGEAVNTCSLTLEEIQATTDLTGKIASASVIKDSVFTIKNVSTAKYIQFGKLVVVKFAAEISGDIITDLPNPAQFMAITLRNNTNGDFSTFYFEHNAVIRIYKATNYTPGDFYSGTFAYITD